MEKLNYEQSYNVMFCFLDKYWDKHNSDNLSLLLGNMSPYTFEGNSPIDKRMTIDWLNLIKTNNVLNEEITLENCFLYMISFLKLQQTSFSLDLQKLISDLEHSYTSKNNLWDLWIHCYSKPSTSLL